tara:strand:+ start:1068 stop:1316 length:249 start_codon:yes stop_codon:yes gene_type:complete
MAFSSPNPDVSRAWEIIQKKYPERGVQSLLADRFFVSRQRVYSIRKRGSMSKEQAQIVSKLTGGVVDWRYLHVPIKSGINIQ